MTVPLGFWIGFHVLIFILLAIDLGVFNKKAHRISIKEAGIFTALWVSLGLLFNLGLYLWAGPKAGLEFLTGYLIEYSLSVDNIFVFVLIFSSFGVPEKYQHRVLFWGILGALIMRGGMIALGTTLIASFHWIIYVFGAFLVFAGVRMFFAEEEETVDLENNAVLKFMRRVLPVSREYDGGNFFTRENGRRLVTPLLLVLGLIEVTDLLFAVDSIPAIFAITQEPFIVYTSNIFAILGLRSLYFLLAGVVHQFVYLRYGLAVVLSFVGIKMLIAEWYHIPTFLSLAVIVVTLAISIVWSLLSSSAKEVEVDPALNKP